MAGIFSKIVKPRNDKLKVWQHIQGDIGTMTRFDSHYYGMYGFMVGQDNEMPEIRPGETYTDAKLRIKRALFWLRQNNPLYNSFYSHYDTLYRYFPGKVIHLNPADNYSDVKVFCRLHECGENRSPHQL